MGPEASARRQCHLVQDYTPGNNNVSHYLSQNEEALSRTGFSLFGFDFLNPSTKPHRLKSALLERDRPVLLLVGVNHLPDFLLEFRKRCDQSVPRNRERPRIDFVERVAGGMPIGNLKINDVYRWDIPI